MVGVRDVAPDIGLTGQRGGIHGVSDPGSVGGTRGRDPVAIGRLKHRQLLALLLINANRVVTTDRLLEELWPDGTEGKENALWVYISRLRAALGQAKILVTRDHGYSLVVDPEDIDTHRFEAAAPPGEPWSGTTHPLRRGC